MSIPQTDGYATVDISTHAKKGQIQRELANRTIPIDIFLDILEPDLGYKFEIWQREQIYICVDPDNDEVLIIRCRGGSKTFDMMVVLVYLAFHGLHCIFWCSVARQKEQPKKYLNYLCTRTFIQYAIIPNRLLSEEAWFKNGGWIWIGNLTPDNARSPRCDCKYADEESRADPDAIDASEPELSVSKLAKTIHGSTPEKGTRFEENYYRLKKEGKPVLERKWDEIKFLNKKVIHRQKANMPGWYFRQEYECSFEAPMGRVFENVIEGDYSHLFEKDIKLNPINLGVDWNGRAGHYLVGSRWQKEFEFCIVCFEDNMGTDMTKVFLKIIKYMEQYPDAKLELEDGGYNAGFCDAFRKYCRDNKLTKILSRIRNKEWDSGGKHKMEAITWLLPISGIYVNKVLTPEVAAWLDKAHWDEDSQDPKLDKDPDQHPLDSFLHSAYVGRDKAKFNMSWVD